MEIWCDDWTFMKALGFRMDMVKKIVYKMSLKTY